MAPIHTAGMRRFHACTPCLLAAALALGGCSDAPAPPPAPQTAASSQVHSPLDTLLQDRAKAEAVQKIVDAHAKRQQQAIEQQSR